MKKWVMLFVIFASFLLSGASAQAHSGSSEAFSDITVDNNGVNYSLRIDLIEFMQAATPEGVLKSSSSLEALNRYLQEHKDQVESYLFSHMKLYADGIPLKGSMTALQVTDQSGRPFAQMQLSFPASAIPELLSLNYNLIYDEVDQGHANYANLTFKGDRQQFLMTYELRDIQLGKMSFLRTAKQFLLHGVEHLFTGYDHILFLIGLMLGAASFKQILALVSSFTAAHSVTLILAGMHVVSLPGKFVEAAIAFSIIYVALNNLFHGNKKHNVWLAFGFGLVHGFGFAGTLSELRLDSGQLISSLLFFNGGIELGQMVIVLAVFPLILYLRKTNLQKWSIPAISVTTSAFGFVWFIQRIFM